MVSILRYAVSLGDVIYQLRIVDASRKIISLALSMTRLDMMGIILFFKDQKLYRGSHHEFSSTSYDEVFVVMNIPQRRVGIPEDGSSSTLTQ